MNIFVEPFNFTPSNSALEQIVRNSESDRVLQKIIANSEPNGPEDKETVFLVLPKYDRNGAFDITEKSYAAYNFKRLASKFHIEWVRAGSHDEVICAMKKITKISHLYICGHGKPDSILLGQNTFLTKEKIAETKFPNLEKNAHILYDACLTGSTDNGLAATQLELFPHAKIFAPNGYSATPGTWLYFEDNKPCLHYKIPGREDITRLFSKNDSGQLLIEEKPISLNSSIDPLLAKKVEADTREIAFVILFNDHRIQDDPFPIQEGSETYRNLERIATRYQIKWIRATHGNEVTQAMSQIQKISHVIILGSYSSLEKLILSGANFPNLSSEPHTRIIVVSRPDGTYDPQIHKTLSERFPQVGCYGSQDDNPGQYSWIYLGKRGIHLHQLGSKSKDTTRVYLNGNTEGQSSEMAIDALLSFAREGAYDDEETMFQLLRSSFQRPAHPLPRHSIECELKECLLLLKKTFESTPKKFIEKNMTHLTDSIRDKDTLNGALSEREFLSALLDFIEKPDSWPKSPLYSCKTLLATGKQILDKLTPQPMWSGFKGITQVVSQQLYRKLDSVLGNITTTANQKILSEVQSPKFEEHITRLTGIIQCLETYIPEEPTTPIDLRFSEDLKEARKKIRIYETKQAYAALRL